MGPASHSEPREKLPSTFTQKISWRAVHLVITPSQGPIHKPSGCVFLGVGLGVVCAEMCCPHLGVERGICGPLKVDHYPRLAKPSRHDIVPPHPPNSPPAT